MKPNETEVRIPMTYEIHANERGEPYLKKVIRTKSLRELGRGQWMPIGRATDHGINRVVELNLLQGHLVLPDQENVYRILVLFN